MSKIFKCTRMQILLKCMSSIDQEPQTELVAQLSQEFYNYNVFSNLVRNLSKLDFEVKLFLSTLFSMITISIFSAM